MATGLIAAAADELLGVLASNYTWVQLHTGDPGANGTANVADEDTRKQVTWASPSGGVLTSDEDLEWEGVPASEDFTHFSVWSAETNGTCGFTGEITANAVAPGDTFRIRAGQLSAFFTVAS